MNLTPRGRISAMESIPTSLIKSLNDLGLSNYEASVYAALVLYDNADAKEIIDFLSISKPSVYEALDRLEDMGLAVKRISKPARYSVISPEMAINLLMDKHRNAGEQALAALITLEKRRCGLTRKMPSGPSTATPTSSIKSGISLEKRTGRSTV